MDQTWDMVSHWRLNCLFLSSQEQRSFQTFCQRWSVPASTTSATRSFVRGTSRHRWVTRVTGWFTGATEPPASSICSSWLIRWDWVYALFNNSWTTSGSVWTDPVYLKHMNNTGTLWHGSAPHEQYYNVTHMYTECVERWTMLPIGLSIWLKTQSCQRRSWEKIMT